jgi:hypothetical protein
MPAFGFLLGKRKENQVIEGSLLPQSNVRFLSLLVHFGHFRHAHPTVGD